MRCCSSLDRGRWEKEWTPVAIRVAADYMESSSGQVLHATLKNVALVESEQDNLKVK
jgi:hypothetical protein